MLADRPGLADPFFIPIILELMIYPGLRHTSSSTP